MSSAVALAAGIVLLLVAPLVVRVAGPQASWTDEDGRRLQTASADYHAALHQHGGSSANSQGGSEAARASVEAARQAYEEQQARFAAVQARGAWLVWGLRLSGVALAGLGVWGYLRSRQ